jgi:FixJ family two-component response regulator
MSSPRSVVIVVDDDPAVRNALKFSFELEGFSVRTYGDALEFLESRDLEASCFVIDQKMPGMCGMDLIAALRARQIRTPAILITTHPATMLRHLAERAHVPIVEKPLLNNVLIDQVRSACASDGGRNQ